MKRWIFPGDLLLKDRQLELDQRKRPLHCYENVAFATFSRQSSRSSHESTTPGTSFRVPQATTAYKYPVNSPERVLEWKRRAKHLHCLNYSCDSSFASLQLSLGFLFSKNWVGKRECHCNWFKWYFNTRITAFLIALACIFYLCFLIHVSNTC